MAKLTGDKLAVGPGGVGMAGQLLARQHLHFPLRAVHTSRVKLQSPAMGLAHSHPAPGPLTAGGSAHGCVPKRSPMLAPPTLEREKVPARLAMPSLATPQALFVAITRQSEFECHGCIWARERWPSKRAVNVTCAGCLTSGPRLRCRRRSSRPVQLARTCGTRGGSSGPTRPSSP